MQEEINSVLLEETTTFIETTTDSVMQEQVNKTTRVFEHGLDKLKEAMPSLVIALLIFVFGVIAAKIIVRIVRRAMKKSNIDNAAKNFLVSFVKIMLYIKPLFLFFF